MENKGGAKQAGGLIIKPKGTQVKSLAASASWPSDKDTQKLASASGPSDKDTQKSASASGPSDKDAQKSASVSGPSGSIRKPMMMLWGLEQEITIYSVNGFF